MRKFGGRLKEVIRHERPGNFTGPYDNPKRN